MRTLALLCVAVLACSKPAEPLPKRATLKAVTGSTFELIPAAEQWPFCLAYTVSAKGVIRQLTMSAENTSFNCVAGQPIGLHAYRVPASEPSVKVLVLFTSQSVNAGSVSQQLIELKTPASITAMELRLPGQAALEVLDFTASPEVPAEEGAVLTPDSTATALDGGGP